MPTSSKWSLPFRLSNQNTVRISHLSHACYMTRPSHTPWFDPLLIIVEAYKLWSSSLWSLHAPWSSLVIWNSSCFCKTLRQWPVRYTRVDPKVSGLAAWSENYKWYSSLPLSAVLSLFCSQSSEFCCHNPLCCFSTSVYCCLFRCKLRKFLDKLLYVFMYVCHTQYQKALRAFSVAPGFGYGRMGSVISAEAENWNQFRLCWYQCERTYDGRWLRERLLVS
jgi:hypothetical protein